MTKTFIQQIYDLVFMPFRLALLPDEWCRRLGLTSLEDERIIAVLPHIKGQLLDIGCGNNRLVREYGTGIGVDVYRWSSDALIVEDTACLPFEDKSFDTITFMACLNHIPNRREVISEAYRLLSDTGQVVASMINPLLGYIGHKIWWYGEDRQRGMAPGEKYGLGKSEMEDLFLKSNYALVLHKRFVYKMNNLYIFRKKAVNA